MATRPPVMDLEDGTDHMLQSFRRASRASIRLLAIGGLAGIAYAIWRLKPDRLVPKAQSPEEHGFGRVLADKYYVDELYDQTVVKPTYSVSRGLLWRGVDTGIIDGLATISSGTNAVVYVWYDNEFGYSCQVIRVMEEMAGAQRPAFPTRPTQITAA